MSSNPHKSDSVALRPGDHVGAYSIERKLGSGGMADVYYAIHQGLERPAALKILRPSLATDETHLQRFLQEARAAASLVHPNIVQVYDVGQAGELRYIAQEYIPGSNLRQYLAKSESPTAEAVEQGSAGGSSKTDNPGSKDKRDRQLEIRETLSILLQILAALNKSAASGIVHRDIKPENIMLTEDGDVKVADFGLARILLGDDPQLTRAGTTLGTPMYMSPEQIQEGKVDIRSDLYSLGVTLFHMLAGRPPFTGETPLALAMQHVQATVPDLPLLRNDIPESLVSLVNQLLAKSPADRFANPQAVLSFLKKHRHADLAEHWPEQTIPLPGAAPAHSGGPLPATLQLQSKLRKQKAARLRQLLSLAGILVLLFGCFVAGATLTYSSPIDLFSLNSDLPGGIERRDSVQEQYRSALFDNRANRLAKWEAVDFFFPRRDSQINRLYAGLADLQLARVYQELGDNRKARNTLTKILNDSQMQSILKAFAHLQVASLASDANDTAGMQAALAKAKAIRNSDSFNAKDREQLDNAVRAMPANTQMLWFD